MKPKLFKDHEGEWDGLAKHPAKKISFDDLTAFPSLGSQTKTQKQSAVVLKSYKSTGTLLDSSTAKGKDTWAAVRARRANIFADSPRKF